MPAFDILARYYIILIDLLSDRCSGSNFDRAGILQVRPMSTFLWIAWGIAAYLAIAGWVHFDTVPPIFDDSQLRRTAKLIVMLPIWLVLFIIFIVVVIVGEYWEYIRGKLSEKQQPSTA